MAGTNEPSQKNFIKYLIKTNDFHAYYKSSLSKQFACLVLHEHLGLVENLVETVDSLIGSKISIFIPDLFSAITSKSLLNNQFDAIQHLKYSHVRKIVLASYQYIKNHHKNVILMGFSVGAAFGWKILEQLDQFFNAFLFYGFPNLEHFYPEKIKTQTIVFSGSKDKIKYLSDIQTAEAVRQRCSSNSRIKFEQISGLEHGFLNPDSQNYSEMGLGYCQKTIFSQLPQHLVDHRDKIKVIKPYEKKKAEEQDSGCIIF